MLTFLLQQQKPAILKKGGEMEWLIEDKGTFVLRRIGKSKSLLHKRNFKPEQRIIIIPWFGLAYAPPGGGPC